MKIEALLREVDVLESKGDLGKSVHKVTLDSRQVEPGSLFAAIRGVQQDGHTFIDNALRAGAHCIVAESLPDHVAPGITWVKVADSAEALGRIASAFYGHPSRQLRLVGVTGTNGKTTIVNLLYQLFGRLGFKRGLLSTIENRVQEEVRPATHTTPDTVRLQALLADMVAAGCDYAFMEVSSHAAHQRRIAGLQFAGAVFTNLSHDHLDYHKTFRNYIEAKKSFFDRLPAQAFALVNIDDKRGEVMVQNTAARVYRYSLRRMADFRAKLLENTLTGLHMELDGIEFFGRLIGAFNAYNLLACYATAVLLGHDKQEVMTALSALRAPEGRFDYQFDPDRKVAGIVDYAHTPDALEKVLQTIRQVGGNQGKVITVVGCGGDRDRAKRPRMAEVACRYSERVILTSDNPRTEDPAAIIREMESGVPADTRQRVLSIPDRAEAIRTACALAGSGDIILVAGKGHEKYQEINGVRHPFDDKHVLNAACFN